jgi:hypothetical protein
MKIKNSCYVILHKDISIRSTILEAGQEITQTYFRGERLYQVIGGKFHRWYFVADKKWESKNTEG